MQKIMICDDQDYQLENVEKIVKERILFAEVPMKIELVTTDPSELVSHLTTITSEKNIYFLDIDLKNETYDGLKLALKIREHDPQGFIIFITSHLEFGMLTFEYKIGAFDYILKTTDSQEFRKRIGEALDAVVKRSKVKQLPDSQNSNLKLIKFVSDYETIQVQVDDLISLEVIGNHKILVSAKYQRFECNGTLSKVFNDLPDYFFKCGRSAIVNLKEIKNRSTKDELLLMSNGTKIQCSRWQQKKFEDLLDKFSL